MKQLLFALILLATTSGTCSAVDLSLTDIETLRNGDQWRSCSRIQGDTFVQCEIITHKGLDIVPLKTELRKLEIPPLSVEQIDHVVRTGKLENTLPSYTNALALLKKKEHVSITFNQDTKSFTVKHTDTSTYVDSGLLTVVVILTLYAFYYGFHSVSVKCRPAMYGALLALMVPALGVALVHTTGWYSLGMVATGVLFMYVLWRLYKKYVRQYVRLSIWFIAVGVLHCLILTPSLLSDGVYGLAFGNLLVITLYLAVAETAGLLLRFYTEEIHPLIVKVWGESTLKQLWNRIGSVLKKNPSP